MIEKLLRKKFVSALCFTGKCSSRVNHSSLRFKDFNHFLQQLYRLLFFKYHNGKIFYRLFFIISRKQRSGSVTIHNDLMLVCLTLFFRFSSRENARRIQNMINPYRLSGAEYWNVSMARQIPPNWLFMRPKGGNFVSWFFHRKLHCLCYHRS